MSGPERDPAPVMLRWRQYTSSGISGANRLSRRRDRCSFANTEVRRTVRKPTKFQRYMSRPRIVNYAERRAGLELVCRKVAKTNGGGAIPCTGMAPPSSVFVPAAPAAGCSSSSPQREAPRPVGQVRCFSLKLACSA
jgi:hypothetical protein